MAEIPSEKIAEVRDRIDIERVVGRTVTLTRKGKRMVGLCPFHNEKSASFGVDVDKKLYHCFGCHAGGDVFDFVMRMDGLDFPSAVKQLAKEAGVLIEDRAEDPREREERQRKERLWSVNRTALDFYSRALEADPRALAYLKEERGLTDETIEQFAVGWAPEGWQSLTDHLEKKKIDLRLGHTLGLLGQSERGGRTYDRLRGRVVFPILVPGGEVAGFGARRADWIDREGPKYLNSPESPVYDKSSILYGLDRARDEIRKSRRAILVEGYLDVILLHQTGLPLAVASCGTALSSRHATLLRRLAPEVVTMYDGDEAGQEATLKTAEILLGEGLRVHVAALPQGDDPDTYARKHGIEGLKTLVDNAPSAIDFFVARAKAANAGAGIAGMTRAVELVKPLLVAIRDPLLRDLSLDASARALSLDPAVLRRHLTQPQDLARRAGSQGQPSSNGGGSPSSPSPDRAPMSGRPPVPQPVRIKPVATPPVVEMALLQLFVESPDEVLVALEDHDAVRAFSHLAIQAAFDAGIEALRRGMPFDAPRALEASKASGHADDAMMVALRRNLMEPRPERDDVVLCVKRLLRSSIDNKVQHLLQRLAKEADPLAAEELAAEADRLHRLKASLS